MARIENMILRLLERTATSGDEADRAEARALLAKLKAPARKPRKSKK